MATFRYRAATPGGAVKTGTLDERSLDDALERLRRSGLTPIEASEAKQGAARIAMPAARARRQTVTALGELAVLLTAGLPLDRALYLCADNIAAGPVKDAFVRLRERVKQGAPLSRAMAEANGLFSPMACAMAEAGEASGKLDQSLAKLAQSLDRAEALRQTIVSALIYPIMLVCVAVSVILVMLLIVVPQFESLFQDMGGKLPFMTMMVMAASDGLRSYGWLIVLALAAAGLFLYRWTAQPSGRRAIDGFVLRLPGFGPLARDAQTARFARTLGSLVESGVQLPAALAIAQRTISNMVMAEAIASVGDGLKKGGGLSGPLAQTGALPRSAMSFVRTGEETAQLGPMLIRLADVLDRDVRNAVERIVALMTPALTIVMGVIVATVIASIMSAILGFNDLAVGP